VGDIDEVNAPFFQNLLENGYTPVLAPLTHDQKGTMLNTNADTIAASVAVGLSAFANVTLTYCFELPGVMKDIDNPESLIREITTDAYNELKEQGIITAGMIPKLDNCFYDIGQGVAKVCIIQAKALKSLDQTSPDGTVLRA
jgi:acetylglutamate kinase